MQTRIRALLVDDHEVMQIGISHALRTYQIDVIDACASGGEAVRLALLYKPDLVLMETALADGSPFEACRKILAGARDMRVIFLTSLDCPEMRNRCHAAGSHGYLLKNAGAQELANAIHAVHMGAGAALKKVPVASSYRLLSPQESKLPPLVADGKTNKEIAEILGLSDKTVKNYLANVFQKLRITRRAQAAAFFVKRQG